MNRFSMPENHTSEKPVPLDADASAAVVNVCNNAIHALGFLRDMSKKNSLSVSTRFNTLGVVRSDLQKLESLLGAKEDLEQDKENDRNLLREANQEIRRLLTESAKGVTISALGQKLHELSQTVDNWWQKLGFSYSKSTCNAYHRGSSLDVAFSVRVDEHISSSILEDKPVSAKAEKTAKVRDLSQEIQIVSDGGHDYYVLDTEANKNWVVQTIKERFPKARIYKWESLSIYGRNDFHLTHVHVFIDLDDIEQNNPLPAEIN